MGEREREIGRRTDRATVRQRERERERNTIISVSRDETVSKNRLVQ